MSLGSYVSYLQKGGGAKLTVECEFIVFGIRIYISVIETGGTANRLFVRPIHGCVGVLRGNIEGRRRSRKPLALVESSTPVYKRSSKLWGHRASVVKAEGGVTNLIVIGSTFKGRIELSPTDTDTAIFRSTGQLA